MTEWLDAWLDDVERTALTPERRNLARESIHHLRVLFESDPALVQHRHRQLVRLDRFEQELAADFPIAVPPRDPVPGDTRTTR